MDTTVKLAKDSFVSIGEKRVTLELSSKSSPRYDENTLAINFYTDFTKKQPVHIMPNVNADAALATMKHEHVRSLFVLDNEAQLLGVITSRILSDHFILEYMSKHGIKNRSDVTVLDLMIPKKDIHVVDYNYLERNKITLKEIIQSFCSLHERHIFVSKNVTDTEVKIIGIISATDVSRALCLNLDTNLESLSFSNLVKYMHI